MFSITKASYYADLLVIPPAWAAALFYAHGGNAFAMVPGFVAWTLLEWNIHRHILHKVYRREHVVHHRSPRSFNGVVWWKTQGLVAAAYLGSTALLGLQIGTGFWAGLAGGFWCYLAAHDRFHHGQPRTWAAGYWRRQYDRHEMHHRGAEANYGVLTPFWDFAFGTLKNPSRAT